MLFSGKPLSFTAEYAEHAETSQNPARIENYLKTLAPAALLRGDKTLWFLDRVGCAANTACPGRQPRDQYPYVA